MQRSASNMCSASTIIGIIVCVFSLSASAWGPDGSPAKPTPELEILLNRKLTFPKEMRETISITEALSMVSAQLPLDLVTKLTEGGAAARLNSPGQTGRQVLDDVAQATNSSWEAQGKTIVFRDRKSEDPTLMVLRSMGRMGVLDEAQAALSLLHALDEKQRDSLRTQGYISYAQLREDQRSQLSKLPTKRMMPTVNGIPLLKLPPSELFFIGGFYLRMKVTLGTYLHQEVVIFRDVGNEDFDPIAPIRGIRDAQQSLQPRAHSSRNLSRALDEIVSVTTSAAQITPKQEKKARNLLRLEVRNPPIYSLGELAEAIRTASGEDVSVDTFLAPTKLFITHRQADLTTDRLMTLMAQATGWSWRTTENTSTLVRHLEILQSSNERLSQVLDLEEQRVRSEMLALAKELWSTTMPSIPEASIQSVPPIHDEVPWAVVPADWKQTVKRILRRSAESVGDEEVAQTVSKALWSPRGMDKAKVRFSLGIIAVIATPPTIHPPGYYWGEITEAIAVERKKA